MTRSLMEKEKENLQHCQNNNDHVSVTTSETNASNSNIDDNCDDMFEDLDDDPFPDEDDDMLLQATQTLEDKEESVVTKPETIAEPLQVKVPSIVKVHPRLEACANDGFGDVNDSFDDFLSQMDIPVVKEEVTKSEKKLVHPNILMCQEETDGFGFGNDSMDELMSQVEMPSTSVKTESTKLPDQFSTSPVLKKPRLNFEFKSSKTSESSNSSAQSRSSGGGSNSSNTSAQSVQSSGYSSSFNKTSQGGKSNVVRKFSSFDSPPREKKLIAKFK